MRSIVLAALVVTATVPSAGAQLMSLRGIASTFCEAVVSGRMGPVLSLLTDELRQAVDGRGEVPILWQGRPEPAETCRPVGNSGTRDRPETVVSFGANGKPGFAQTIVMVVVDGALRIDDVKFDDGTTLRGRLAVRA
jgi:hypothetical protein